MFLNLVLQLVKNSFHIVLVEILNLKIRCYLNKKIWDTRKLTSVKKQIEATPLYMIENQVKCTQFTSTATPCTKKPISKGYSNLLFNSSKSLLYANCMNNYLYEFNLVTYNSNHTRAINQKLNIKSKIAYHTNTSNFIKSSLSKCDNFLLTGSSDFNAYIYPTNINNEYSRHYKRQMPAIVLKGHTNEVTAVQWNPLDPNQLITCSDDNTIRCWNVRRELDDLTTKECNFSSAITINEFDREKNDAEKSETEETPKEGDDECFDEDYDDFLNYYSSIRNNRSIYTKYRPHSTGHFDDYIFINYEYKNFMRKNVNKTLEEKLNLNLNLENELCLKCKYININTCDDAIDSIRSSSPDSPTSVMLNSIEKDLKR